MGGGCSCSGGQVEGYLLGTRNGGGVNCLQNVCQVASGEIRHERRAVPRLWWQEQVWAAAKLTLNVGRCFPCVCWGPSP